VDDVGFVNPEALRLSWLQAGRVTRGAFDIGDGAAAAADHVVVVVTGLRFVPGDRTGRLDLPEQSGFGERAQTVVDRLVGDLAEVRPDCRDDRVRIGVGILVYCAQHGDPGTGYAQVGPAQFALEFRGHRHGRKDTRFPESIQITDHSVRLSPGVERSR